MLLHMNKKIHKNSSKFKKFLNIQELLQKTNIPKLIKANPIIFAKKSINEFYQDYKQIKKREELISPIQQQIYDTIEAMAKQKAYDFIFDSSSNSNILFASEEFNKSEEVLKAILK